MENSTKISLNRLAEIAKTHIIVQGTRLTWAPRSENFSIESDDMAGCIRFYVNNKAITEWTSSEGYYTDLDAKIVDDKMAVELLAKLKNALVKSNEHDVHYAIERFLADNK